MEEGANGTRNMTGMFAGRGKTKRRLTVWRRGLGERGKGQDQAAMNVLLTKV